MMLEHVPLSSKQYKVENLADRLQSHEIKAISCKSVQRAIYLVEKEADDGTVPQSMMVNSGLRSSYAIFCQN